MIRGHGNNGHTHCLLIGVFFACKNYLSLGASCRCCVHCLELEGCPLFRCCFYIYTYMEISVGACSSVRYLECPLIESPLYLLVAALAVIIDNRNIMW